MGFRALVTAKIQELNVYEINERDRGSPAYLRLSYRPVNTLGDLVPFSDKVSPHHDLSFVFFLSQENLTLFDTFSLFCIPKKLFHALILNLEL